MDRATEIVEPQVRKYNRELAISLLPEYRQKGKGGHEEYKKRLSAEVSVEDTLMTVATMNGCPS